MFVFNICLVLFCEFLVTVVLDGFVVEFCVGHFAAILP